MYQINRQSNRIEPLQVKTFAELGFSERNHLQEWLAHHPEALGEPLLIIQKEFAGFEDTKERLDLLALDKSGRLVIIENKLDDSGRDVVWQALKYASYCSRLKKDQVIGVFQQYLNSQKVTGDSTDARAVLQEFFGDRDLDEVQINPSSEQRVIFVAANFRKEVTSTALWLMEYRLRLQCFKVTPYKRGEDVFLSLDQIIPPPEAADYIIGVADKKAEDQSSEDEIKSRHVLREQFWTLALEAVKASPCRLFDHVNPSDRGKAGTGSGIGAVWYELVFGFTEVRVQLYFDREADENKWLFDQLHAQRELIEQTFGDHLVWDPMVDRKASQIRYAKAFDGRNKELWPAMAEWLTQHITQLHLAVGEPLMSLRSELLKRGGT
jgi:hypothetical protein